MTAKLQIAIVDDEELARARVRRLLGQLELDCQVAEFQGCTDFLHHQAQGPFDVAILDIALQDGNGLALAQEIKQSSTALIFATAYENHALAAFGLAAFDYLLKPFDATRLAEALRRVQERRVPRSPEASAQQRLCLPFGNEHRMVDIASIWFVRAQANYVEVHCKETSYLLRTTLRGFLERLASPHWLRIHRSVAVSTLAVSALRTSDNAERILVLADGRELPVSRSYRESVQRALGLTSSG